MYSKIQETLPYIISLNSIIPLQSLMELCEREMKLIDREIYSREHIDASEIQSAFQIYFDKKKQ